MDPAVIVAIVGGIAALAGALIGAIPLYLQSKNQSESNRIAVIQNNEVILTRLAAIEKKLDKQEQKTDKHDEHSVQIAELQARMHSVEDHIERLSRYHSN